MTREPISPNQAALRAHVIKSLAHPSRIQMVDALSAGELCVRELTALVGSDMSTVSKHLSVLKSVGLVSVEKRGLNQFYHLNCDCLADFFCCVDAISVQHTRNLQAACCQ